MSNLPRYYAANVNSDGHFIDPPAGPLATYTAALAVHRMTPPRLLDGVMLQPPTEDRRILLDVGSIVPADKEKLDFLLLHDPVLACLFQLGISIGIAMNKAQP